MNSTIYFCGIIWNLTVKSHWHTIPFFFLSSLHNQVLTDTLFHSSSSLLLWHPIPFFFLSSSLHSHGLADTPFPSSLHFFSTRARVSLTPYSLLILLFLSKFHWHPIPFFFSSLHIQGLTETLFPYSSLHSQGLTDTPFPYYSLCNQGLSLTPHFPLQDL